IHRRLLPDFLTGIRRMRANPRQSHRTAGGLYGPTSPPRAGRKSPPEAATRARGKNLLIFIAKLIASCYNARQYQFVTREEEPGFSVVRRNGGRHARAFVVKGRWAMIHAGFRCRFFGVGI